MITEENFDLEALEKIIETNLMLLDVDISNALHDEEDKDRITGLADGLFWVKHLISNKGNLEDTAYDAWQSKAEWRCKHHLTAKGLVG